MGFLYSLKQAAQGNFENAFNGFWVSDDLLAAQDQAGDALSAKVASDQANGLIDATQASKLYAEMSPATNSDAYWNSSGDSPLTVFNQTLNEEASNISGFGSKAINRVMGLGFRVIPWQVYLIGLILVMIWLYPFWKPFATKVLSGKK